MSTIIGRAPTAALLILPAVGAAHVPYLEERDYSAEAPLAIENVTNSKALNARLEPAGDVDFFSIRLAAPTRLLISSNVPFCPQYRDFSVTFALIGSGLPPPEVKLPVPLPDGTGAIVVRDVIADPGQRAVYFEPISGRQTWPGPDLVRDRVPPGDYRVIFWNEQGRAGDYIGVIGETDIFGPADREQAKRIAPRLEHGKNLMVPCDPTAPDAAERRKKRNP
jgi:hypothetical protein